MLYDNLVLGWLKMLLVLFSMCCLFATMDVRGIPRDVKHNPRPLLNTVSNTEKNKMPLKLASASGIL